MMKYLSDELFDLENRKELRIILMTFQRYV